MCDVYHNGVCIMYSSAERAECVVLRVETNKQMIAITTLYIVIVIDVVVVVTIIVYKHI